MPRTRVTFEETPNPNAGKFTVDRVLVEGRRGRTYATADEAADLPVIGRILADPDVLSVFVVADFVTVTKRAEAHWRDLAPRISALLREGL